MSSEMHDTGTIVTRMQVVVRCLSAGPGLALALEGNSTRVLNLDPVSASGYLANMPFP